MAGAIRTRWILLHMKSEGGEEAAVNPLAVLCLTDSIVLFRFLAAEEPPARRTAMKSANLGRMRTDLRLQKATRGGSDGMAVRQGVPTLRGSGMDQVQAPQWYNYHPLYVSKRPLLLSKYRAVQHKSSPTLDDSSVHNYSLVPTLSAKA